MEKDELIKISLNQRGVSRVELIAPDFLHASNLRKLFDEIQPNIRELDKKIREDAAYRG